MSAQERKHPLENAHIKQKRRLFCIFVFLLVVVIAFAVSMLTTLVQKPSQDPSRVCYTQNSRIVLEALDQFANPCVDFYQYACGGWIARHPIPPHLTGYTAFDDLRIQLSTNLSVLLEESRSKGGEVPKAVKFAAEFYHSCVNKGTRREKGLSSLKFLLKEHMGWPMAEIEWNEMDYQWYIQVAKIIRNLGKGAIIFSSVAIDSKNSSKNVIYLEEASFGLDKTELLKLNTQKNNKDLIEAYKKYMKLSAKLLCLECSDSLLNEDVESVVEFESSLAQLSTSFTEKRHREISSHQRMTVNKMQLITENEAFKWKDFLNALFQGQAMITDSTEVVLENIDYIKNALKVINNTKKRTIANYIGWQIVMGYGPHATMEFLRNYLNFLKVKPDSWNLSSMKSLCLDLAVQLMGFAVSRIYIDRYVVEESRTDMAKIINKILSAYHTVLRSSSLIDDATKAKALNKLETMKIMVAYPSWIKKNRSLNDYYQDVVKLNQTDFFSFLLAISKAVMVKNMEQLNEPNNRTSKWMLYPTVINAFYNPGANAITLPVGILNAPFYKYGRTMSLNYGGIGSVIGHEMSHGFGFDRNRFNKHGVMMNWWSETVRQKYVEITNCFKEQYSSYIEPLTQMHLNGNSTVGENIADNKGLQSSYIAYKLMTMLSEDIDELKELPGISATPDQLFFIGYASSWCGSQRKVALKHTIQNDNHSPKKYRVLIPLSNFKAFSEAFNCPVGSPMNPKSKCSIW